MLDSDSRKRVRQLATKLVASPTLPLLGWTKVVEAAITFDKALGAWVGYATVITLAWIFADDIRETVDDATD